MRTKNLTGRAKNDARGSANVIGNHCSYRAGLCAGRCSVWTATMKDRILHALTAILAYEFAGWFFDNDGEWFVL